MWGPDGPRRPALRGPPGGGRGRARSGDGAMLFLVVRAHERRRGVRMETDGATPGARTAEWGGGVQLVRRKPHMRGGVGGWAFVMRTARATGAAGAHSTSESDACRDRATRTRGRQPNQGGRAYRNQRSQGCVRGGVPCVVETVGGQRGSAAPRAVSKSAGRGCRCAKGAAAATAARGHARRGILCVATVSRCGGHQANSVGRQAPW